MRFHRGGAVFASCRDRGKAESDTPGPWAWFLFMEAGGGQICLPGPIIGAGTAGPVHPGGLGHNAAWAEDWLCDFCFRESSWTDTPGPTGRFPVTLWSQVY